MKEKEVKEAVKKYFEKEFNLVRTEFDIGGARADIAAFKWDDNYMIKAIAVECKGTQNVHSLVESAQEQAREYQIAFPYVYLAIPSIRENKKLKNMLELLRIGLLSVSEEGKVKEELEPDHSLRLKWDEYFLKVRQRAIAIWTFSKVAAPEVDKKIDVEYNPNGVACWINEPANFLITNNEVQTEGDYHFGVNIEQTKNVEGIIGNCDCNHLYNLISSLPASYIFRICYIYTRRPRTVWHPILIKRVRELKSEDIEWLVDYSRKNKWKTGVFIEREAWEKYEALEKEEHLKRAKRIADELKELRSYLLSLG